jgi:hypothetical protein
LQSIWGNFQLAVSAIPTEALCEIRSGMSPGNAGTLLFSTVLPIRVTATGRSHAGTPEYQVVADLSLTLGSGMYWLGMAPVGGFFDNMYISTTSANDAGPATDPNPPPIGSPLRDGTSYQMGPGGITAQSTETTTLGPGTWDFSYGVIAQVPEPSTISLAGLSILLGVVLNRVVRKQREFTKK